MLSHIPLANIHDLLSQRPVTAQLLTRASPRWLQVSFQVGGGGGAWTMLWVEVLLKVANPDSYNNIKQKKIRLKGAINLILFRNKILAATSFTPSVLH